MKMEVHYSFVISLSSANLFGKEQQKIEVLTTCQPQLLPKLQTLEFIYNNNNNNNYNNNNNNIYNAQIYKMFKCA